MALLIVVKVVPSSGRRAWVYDKQGRLKLYIKSPAQQGRANTEVIKIIAEVVGVTHTAVHIITGAISPHKRIKIDTAITLQQFLQRIGADVQQSFLS